MQPCDPVVANSDLPLDENLAPGRWFLTVGFHPSHQVLLSPGAHGPSWPFVTCWVWFPILVARFANTLGPSRPKKARATASDIGVLLRRVVLKIDGFHCFRWVSFPSAVCLGGFCPALWLCPFFKLRCLVAMMAMDRIYAKGCCSKSFTRETQGNPFTRETQKSNLPGKPFLAIYFFAPKGPPASASHGSRGWRSPGSGSSCGGTSSCWAPAAGCARRRRRIEKQWRQR